MKTTASYARLKAPALAVALCSLLAGGLGCRTTAPAGVLNGPELARALRSRGLDPAKVVVPFELNAEMRAWAHKVVPDHTSVDKRLDLILAGLLDPEWLRLEYRAGTTETAQGVFASHHANCLGFTNLFVGMGREVGVPVFYLDVDDLEKYEKEGDLVVESGHISAGYDRGGAPRVLEFARAASTGYRRVHPISDLTAIALFYSNRGAELLRGGRQAEALGWLRDAVILDPELARAWVNLGVARRRNGDLAGAEAAYRKSLELDPGASAAYRNLAALLRYRGQTREADELVGLMSRLDSRNPYNYLALGDLALAHKRLDEARRFYRTARRLGADGAETCAALGELSLAAGDRRAAKSWLRKASARDAANERVKRLAAHLLGLEEAAKTKSG